MSRRDAGHSRRERNRITARIIEVAGQAILHFLAEGAWPRSMSPEAARPACSTAVRSYGPDAVYHARLLDLACTSPVGRA